MHAIILSAGRGSRLLPLTSDLPKCLLPIGLTTVLGMQLDTLYAAGIKTATVVTGFNAHMVEAEINSRQKGPNVTTLFNPFYQVADNLASCWMARGAMDGDFLLINGDTLFSPNVIKTVLDASTSNIKVTVDKKDHYDGDDMKVTLDGARLTAIGKTLSAEETNGESIGMLRFMDRGPEIFRAELERLLRTKDGTKNWFLSAIHGLAQAGVEIDTTLIKGYKWAELDTTDDYEVCRAIFGSGDQTRKRFAVV